MELVCDVVNAVSVNAKKVLFCETIRIRKSRLALVSSRSALITAQAFSAFKVEQMRKMVAIGFVLKTLFALAILFYRSTQ